jgi:hypothetical protein
MKSQSKGGLDPALGAQLPGFLIGTYKNVEQMNLATIEDGGIELVLQTINAI